MTAVGCGGKICSRPYNKSLGISSLHESYVEKDLQMLKDNPDHKVHPYSVPWDRLPENIRNANRAVADYFPIKLCAVGCKMVAKRRN